MDVDKGLSKPGALRRRLPWFFVNATLMIGLFAPLIANNVPVFAEVDGTYTFPAFADLVGDAPPGPHDLTWKQWYSQLGSDSEDWALMPLWPYGPLETNASLFSAQPSLQYYLGIFFKVRS